REPSQQIVEAGAVAVPQHRDPDPAGSGRRDVSLGALAPVHLHERRPWRDAIVPSHAEAPPPARRPLQPGPLADGAAQAVGTDEQPRADRTAVGRELYPVRVPTPGARRATVAQLRADRAG